MADEKERKTLEQRHQMSDLERLRHSCMEANSGGGIPASSRQSSGEYTQSSDQVTAILTKGLVASGGKAQNTYRFELRRGILLLYERRGSDTNVEFRPVR